MNYGLRISPPSSGPDGRVTDIYPEWYSPPQLVTSRYLPSMPKPYPPLCGSNQLILGDVYEGV